MADEVVKRDKRLLPPVYILFAIILMVLLHFFLPVVQLSLSRLNHWLPRAQAHPEIVEGTAQFHHQITDPLLPQTEAVFHDAAALHTAIDVLDPQPPLVERGIAVAPRGLPS